VYDACVIGAGAAGITLATGLARKGRSVFLAEAGDVAPTAESQDHYLGAVVGDPYFDLRGTRLRYLGGSSGTWGGLCRELDPQDFRAKTASARTAWPIDHLELSRFAAAAAAVLQVPTQSPDRALNLDVSEIFFEFSPPVRFGETYRDEVSSSTNIDAFLNCNFLGFRFDGRRIEGAEFTNYSADKALVNARVFVLACGGIENSRILLLENGRFENRLGNRHDLVGRYWTEHNHFTIGDFFLFDHDAFKTKARVTPSGAGEVRVFVSPTRRFIETESILNCGLRLLPLYQRTGAKKHLADLLCKTPNLSNALLEPLGEQLVCSGTIRGAWEQFPEFENRIVLSTERDSFGLQRCELRWRKSSRDKLAARKTALALGKYLAGHDIGRIKLASWLLRDDDEFPTDDEIGGNHHMGGTRMAEHERVPVFSRLVAMRIRCLRPFSSR
jgi:choline dehydrogenase-like flavoprotein